MIYPKQLYPKRPAEAPRTFDASARARTLITVLIILYAFYIAQHIARAVDDFAASTERYYALKVPDRMFSVMWSVFTWMAPIYSAAAFWWLAYVIPYTDRKPPAAQWTLAHFALVFALVSLFHVINDNNPRPTSILLVSCAIGAATVVTVRLVVREVSLFAAATTSPATSP